MKEHVSASDFPRPSRGGAGGDGDSDKLGVAKWIEGAVAAIRSGDRAQRKEGLMTIRKLISLDDEEMIPFDFVLSTGIVTDATAFLDSDDLEEVYQAIWFFTNIASSSHTNIIVEFDGLFYRIIRFLQHGDVRIRDQAVWCIANVVGDCVEYRDLFYAFPDYVTAFMFALDHIEDSDHLGNLAWLTQNLCLGNPKPNIDIVAEFLIPVIGTLLFEDSAAETLRESHEVVNCAIYALKLLTERQDEIIQVVLDCGVLPTVVQFLNHPSPAVVLGACQILGNVASGEKEQTAHVRDGELWNILFGITHFKFAAGVKSSIEKEVCFFLSNLVLDMEKGDPLYGHPLIQHVISLVPHATAKVVQEASFLVFNLVQESGEDVIVSLLDEGLLKAIYKMIGSAITDARHNGLVVLKNLCKSYPRVVSQAEALGIEDKLNEMDGVVQDKRSQELINYLLGICFNRADGDSDGEGEWD